MSSSVGERCAARAAERDEEEFSGMKSPSETHGHRLARVILSLISVLWGLVILGVALWLFGRHASVAAFACLMFSAGYCVFAWSIFKDSTWNEERPSRDADFSDFEPRSRAEPREFDRNARTRQGSLPHASQIKSAPRARPDRAESRDRKGLAPTQKL
ncbi:hypothetical protein B1812_00985 [Methylocystis bryophila]|uniref:Uncharacterized protein n=1 Tax=Methylocystis bryophila TaxID=655015 RepID=A0A1W6MQK1_9HYPH|nr:hypothetical protein B1812_00985 [Methylocystis bryophila]